MLPTSILDLREAIKYDPAFSGWEFLENQSVFDAGAGGFIEAGTFSIWKTPDGEEIVVSLINVTLTGS